MFPAHLILLTKLTDKEKRQIVCKPPELIQLKEILYEYSSIEILTHLCGLSKLSNHQNYETAIYQFDNTTFTIKYNFTSFSVINLQPSILWSTEEFGKEHIALEPKAYQERIQSLIMAGFGSYFNPKPTVCHLHNAETGIYGTTLHTNPEARFKWDRSIEAYTILLEPESTNFSEIMDSLIF